MTGCRRCCYRSVGGIFLEVVEAKFESLTTASSRRFSFGQARVGKGFAWVAGRCAPSEPNRGRKAPVKRGQWTLTPHYCSFVLASTRALFESNFPLRKNPSLSLSSPRESQTIDLTPGRSRYKLYDHITAPIRWDSIREAAYSTLEERWVTLVMAPRIRVSHNVRIRRGQKVVRGTIIRAHRTEDSDLTRQPTLDRVSVSAGVHWGTCWKYASSGVQ